MFSTPGSPPACCPAPRLGWPEHPPDLDAFYPTRLLVTGFDILFFWVARMIMLGCHFMLEEPMADGSKRTLKDAVPFREVYIHALVRDADRQKMSKTKGNVIDPIQVVERFGTDAVRFTLAAMAAPGTDIAFSEERTDGYRAFANKIWNAARFIFMQMERAAEAGIVVDLQPACGSASRGRRRPTRSPLDSSPACIAPRARSTRRWGSIASTRRPTRSTASSGAISATGTSKSSSCVSTSAALPPQYARRWPPCWESSSRPCACCLRSCPLSPRRSGTRSTKIILPPSRSRSRAILRRGQISIDGAAEQQMERMQELIVAVRDMRRKLGVEEKAAVPILLRVAPAERAGIEQNSDIIGRLAKVSAIEFVDTMPEGAGVRSAPGFDVAVVYERTIDVAVECERLTKELARFEKEVSNADRQLSNEGFLAKAPANVVEGLRRRAAELSVLIPKTRSCARQPRLRP